MSRLSSLNNKKSTDKPTRGTSDELHITGLEVAQAMTLLPEKVVRARFSDHYKLEPMPEIPRYITLPNFPLFQAINDNLLDKHEKDDYEIIPINTTIRTFLNTHEFTNDIKYSDYVATDRKNKIRYTTQIPYTVSECAREYIRICEFLSGDKLEKRRPTYQNLLRASPTHYFSGHHKGNLAYIDLKAAYWSILWPTTINMEYDPIKQEIASIGTISYHHADQFTYAKEIRKLIHSLYNYRYIKIWHHNEKHTTHIFPPSELYFPYNVWYIYDIINAIVTEVKEKFTLYQWLTDAAIIPANQANALMEYLFNEWFLESTLKYIGEGISNATNNYQIGSKETGGFRPRRIGTEHNKLREANIDGLKAERMKLVKREIPIAISKRQAKMPGSGYALKTAQSSTYTPKTRTKTPKQNRDFMHTEKNTVPPPEDTIDVTEFLNKRKK